MLKIRSFVRIIRNEIHILRAKNSANGKLDFAAAELIRNTHSMEKGLSISEPRLGFGHQKQQEMMTQIQLLWNNQSVYRQEACRMALGALSDYIRFHKERNFSDEVCSRIEAFLKEYPVDEFELAGGTIRIKREELKFDTEEIESFFRSRHSVRDFDGTPVNEDLLEKALVLAQKAPSACNRQGVRAYVLSHEKSRELSGKLTGIGGFAEDVDRFIIITGKTSAYRPDEIDQYIVSASIYAAYLTLTLHLYGIAACVVQRNLLYSKSWGSIQARFGIPEDEQCVCVVSVGNYKDITDVPASHRLSSEEVIRFIR